MADRRARHNAGGRRNSQYRQLTLQRSKRLNDHARHIALIGGAAALLRFGPSGIDGVGGTHHRLAVTRRAHHRLDHARIADFRSSGAQLFQRAGKTIRCSRQAQFFVGQYAQALAVHANRGDFGARHHLGARGRSTGQHIGGDGLYLGHDDVRLDFIEQCLQFGGIRHIQRAIFMRHLLGRSAGIRVSGAHPRAQSHELDGHFLAQLTSAQKQHAGGVLAQRCAQRAVGCASCGETAEVSAGIAGEEVEVTAVFTAFSVIPTFCHAAMISPMRGSDSATCAAERVIQYWAKCGSPYHFIRVQAARPTPLQRGGLG